MQGTVPASANYDHENKRVTRKGRNRAQFAVCNVHCGMLEFGVWMLDVGCWMLAIADAHGAMPFPDSRKPKILIYGQGINCI